MQISLFQRYKAFVNSHAIGETYTTDQLFENVGRYESETMWKRRNKQRMYRTSTYQTYLHRLGAVQNVKRGLWKVLHHVPEWFYSKHVNYLLGYERNEWSLDYMLDQGFPRELAERVHIPKHHRVNPFKSAPKIVESSEKVTIDVELLKELYKEASQVVKDRLQKDYPSHFETYYDFGNAYEIVTTHYTGPLMIAKGLAPAFLECKCLIVSPDYKLCTKEQTGFTFIYFVKK